MEQNDFWHKRQMDHFDPYNVLLAITNIPVLLMTAFVLQGHISISAWIIVVVHLLQGSRCVCESVDGPERQERHGGQRQRPAHRRGPSGGLHTVSEGQRRPEDEREAERALNTHRDGSEAAGGQSASVISVQIQWPTMQTTGVR